MQFPIDFSIDSIDILSSCVESRYRVFLSVAGDAESQSWVSNVSTSVYILVSFVLALVMTVVLVFYFKRRFQFFCYTFTCIYYILLLYHTA